MLGISRDTVKAQARFKEKCQLPYTLLSDSDEVVCEAYGVLKEKTMYGRKVKGIERTTFIIGPDGVLTAIFRKVKAKGHVQDLLADLS